MLPFLRRNTTAGVEPEIVQVENEEWVDPVERAVREVGLGAQGESVDPGYRARSARLRGTR